MQPDWQIPRHALAWLLIAFVAVNALHAEHLPAWLIVAAIGAVGWRVQIYRGAWRYPKTREKLMLLTSCAGGLLLQYGRLSGLDPMVALLICAYTMKLLEMHRKRDVYVLVFLGYFVAALVYLYFQTMGTAFYVIVSLVPVTAALVALHQSASTPFMAPLKKASGLLVQSIPLMLVLFMVMPRLGALWAVPQQNKATTGVSSTMSPGDFSQLGRSARTAFRVEFDGAPPPRQQLYWRGLVLSKFDGRTWHQDLWRHAVGRVQMYGAPVPAWDQQIERLGEPLSYRVTIEPTNANWLFALSTPRPMAEGIGLTRGYNLAVARRVVAKQQYPVKSWLNNRLSPDELTLGERQAALQLPGGFNPETLRIAQQWRRETSTDEQLVDRLLRLFNREYVYTLQPPALGKHTVDEFLWGTKRGFCEHFAGSFVFFMRAAGVPARVVAGYQGGEMHPSEQYMTVRQYDAHAWTEVWLRGKGWTRVDPTFAVAPQRIESSIFDVLGEEEDFLSDSPLALIRYRDIDWLNSLRLQLESLDYAWAKWVLGYESVQQQTLRSLLGKIDPLRIGLLLLAGAVLGLLPLMINMVRTRTNAQYDELDRLFVRFCKRMAKAGVPRNTGEAPRDYLLRVIDAFPEHREAAQRITDYYEKGRYRGDSQDARQMNLLLQQL